MNRIKHVFILFVDFIGLLIILSILSIVLNYFKIIPLSKNFPKYFGFLPQILQKTVIITPTLKPIVSAFIWDKEAAPTLISNYSDYFKNHNVPVTAYGETIDMFSVNGAFTAYNKDYIQSITSDGLTFFQINKDSVFRKIIPPVTTKNQRDNGIGRVTATYKNSADFYRDTPFGSYLQIIYQLKNGIKIATSIDYYPEHKY